MKRITLILATVATMAVMILAAAAPALAHSYEWTDWWQWRDTNWWCSTLWFHDHDDGWEQEAMFCYNVRTGDYWNWP